MNLGLACETKENKRGITLADPPVDVSGKDFSYPFQE